MYDRFTTRARKVIQLAKEEAQRLNHEYIGAEHLLLGIVSEGSGVSAKVLERFGVDLGQIRTEVEKLVVAGSSPTTLSQQLPYTPRAKRCIQFAFEEARDLGHNYIGTEHILLGLLREGEGIAKQVLTNLGLDPLKVKNEALSVLGMEMSHGRHKQGKDEAGGKEETLRQEVSNLLAERRERDRQMASRGEAQFLREKQIAFWREFSQLISSSVPILETLDVIAAEIQHNELAVVAKEMRSDVADGGAPSDTLERYPAIFSKSAIALIKAGEASGRLDEMAARLAEGLEKGIIPVGTAGGLMNGANVKPPAKGPAPAAEANELIRDAIEQRASDVHIEPVNEDVGRVRFRIDGTLREKKRMDRALYDRLIARVKIMANLDAGEREAPQDGRMLLKTEDGEFDLRVAICPSIHGESAAIKILRRSDALLDLEQAGFTDENLQALRNWMRRPSGIILSTGPVGSGKTTVMYAMLNEMSSEGVKIVTVEDPIERDLEGIVQVPVDEKKGLTFERAIRSVLRQDPDVVMVSEMRELETADLIFQVALTGRLVITTLHTGEATSALKRLTDCGIEPFLVNDCVIGAISQRLVRKVCPACKEAYTPPESELQRIGASAGAQFYRARGCDHCASTGYRGRIAVVEIVELGDALRKAIASGASPQQIRRIAIESGMRTMREDGIQKATKGITTLEEVLRVTQVSFD